MYVKREKGAREREKQGKYVKMKMDKERGRRRKAKCNSFTKSKLYSEVVVLVENVSQEDRTNVRYGN
jgi:hypothetical protein